MGKKSAKDGGLKSGAVILSVSAGATRTGPVADGKARFVKDLLRIGHSIPRTDGERMEVTDELLATMADSTNRFIASGGQVPALVATDPHEAMNDAEAVRGQWSGFFVEDGALRATLEIDADDEELTEFNNVSIYALAQYTDTKKQKYDWPILHVAITPSPAVIGLGEFVKIAASGRSVDVPVFKLAVGDSAMDWKKKLAGLLGVEVADGMTEEQLAEAILKHVEAMKASGDPDKKAEEAEKVAASLRAEVATLKASRGKPQPETNPQILKLSAKNRTAELSRLVTEGRITPAVRDRLAACWIGKDNGALKLSLDDESDRRFDEMVAALGENDPVKLGEQTAAQGVALSRHAPGDTSRVDPVANDKYMAERLAALKPKNGA